MKVIKEVKKLCLCCMEEHLVQVVEENETNIFKDEEVSYIAKYEYCDKTDDFICDEDMIKDNDIAMKNAYRTQHNLLTSDEIIKIRHHYSISQKDLACLLGWGEKTITRYEGHQVQDKAHDAILRKLSNDPEWFLELLEDGKDYISLLSYEKCKKEILKAYETMQDLYLKKSIQAQQAKYQIDSEYSGNTKLNFDKIVDVVCYYANSTNIINLYKVKLMKMLWYADFLSFKRYNHSITGLVYSAMPMGALPLAHQKIINLTGISYEDIEFENGSGCKFTPNNHTTYTFLTSEDISVLNEVIKVFGGATKNQIVEQMHKETAYRETERGNAISFKYAQQLSLS